MNHTSRRDDKTFLLWNTLLWPFVPALGLYTLYRRYGQKKSAASLRGQWGLVPRDVVEALGATTTTCDDEIAPRIWMHAVSVGETLASRPVARALKTTIPTCKIALSVTTDTGYEAAQTLLKSGEVDGVLYFPLDIPFAVNRVLDALQPQIFLTMETELWPNVLHLAKCRGVRTFLVNGRVSDNLQKRAPQLGALWRWMMSNIDGFLMRSETDAARIERLGAPSEKIHATGDVKLDAMTNVKNVAEIRARWREKLRIPDDALLFVAGSTHEGEDEIVLRAWQSLRHEFPTLQVLVASRHIERVADVLRICERLQIEAVRRSEIGEQNKHYDVIILDSVGELSQIYAAADVAFVGGSLIMRGGHNLLEPVLCGVPVAFGPHIANFRAHAQLIKDADVGQLVSDGNELTETLRVWLRNQKWRNEVTLRADETLQSHRGASNRVAQIIAQTLEFTAENADKLGCFQNRDRKRAD